MRHFIRAVAVMAVLAGSSGANALDAAKSAAIAEAANAFAALAADAAKTGRAPRQSDPAAKPLLDRVLDTRELQTGPARPMSALSQINSWNQAVLKIGLIYILAGTGATDISALPNNAATNDRIARNTVDYAPEMGRYMDAQLWLQAAITDTVADFVAAASPAQLDQPNIKNGLHNIRAGVARTINGVITTLPTEGLSDSWRAERIAVLVVIGAKVARLVAPEDLAALRTAAITAVGGNQDAKVKSGLAALTASLTPR